jgi:hypothetical protein
VAKKKTANKGINLIKGITGSQLAKLATLAIVLLAIPLTISLTKQQQNIQQEAAVSYCEKLGGECINTNYIDLVNECSAKGNKNVEDLCKGENNIKCCLPPQKATE